MAEESIATLRKPNFPQTSNTEKTYQTTIEYIGEYDELYAAQPVSNAEWGDFEGLVTSTILKPIHGTYPLLAEMTVVVEYNYSQGDSPEDGISLEVTYEIEWMMFSRSMYEHPAFAPGQGGSYSLSSNDIAAIEAWKNNEDVNEKSVYRYKTNPDEEAYEELSDSARKFAQGIELGQETFEDFAPVVRKSTIYARGIPDQSQAGQKEDPPAVNGVPIGYEWRKQADRAIQNGQTRWDKVEEWIGAKKILCDKDEIFW